MDSYNNKLNPILTVIVTKNYYPSDSIPNTLQLIEDDIIYVMDISNDNWWDGISIDPVGNISRGWFPPSHTKTYMTETNDNINNNFEDKNDDIDIDIGNNKNIFGINESQKALFQSPSSQYNIINNNISNRRQSFRTRHQSYSHGNVNSNSPKPIIHSFSDTPSHSSNLSHQVSNMNNNVIHPSSSSTSLFKEKNYFISKHNSLSSTASQYNQPESRQSSQAFTEMTTSSIPNSIHLVSKEEVSSYFQPVNPQSQPSFNFVPVWIPNFTQDCGVVYKNQALNVFTEDIPFIDTDYINDKSLFESPDTTNLVNDLSLLPITLKRENMDSSMNSISQNINPSFNVTKSMSIQDSLPSNYRPQLESTNQYQIFNNLSDILNSRPTEIFYLDNTDILTWDTLSSSFIKSIDESISSLQLYDKLNFKISMNDASNTFSLYHIAGRLIKQNLIDSNKIVKFSAILKKLTNTFIQFKIWSTLAIASIDRLENIKTDKLNNLSTTQINRYINDSINYKKKLEKLSIYLCSFISSLSMRGPDGILHSNNSKILPMVYSRFIRDKFEAGNFKNQFSNINSFKPDFFINSNQNQVNILLDDDVLNRIKLLEKKISNGLKEIQDILNDKIPQGVPLKRFLDDRNLKLLTSIYQCIPILASFMDIIESIDLTVFAMIDKLAAKPIEYIRQDTLISQRDNSPLSEGLFGYSSQIRSNSHAIIDNDDFNNEFNDDLDNSNQAFYDATAKIFRPMIQDFGYLKQTIHSAFTDLILDAQTISADDPETFFAGKTEKISNEKGSAYSLKVKQVADIMMKRLEQIDLFLYNDGIYALEPTLKLTETIKLANERVHLLRLSVSQLKDERKSILNYCSRLMNTDFNIASLFINERHNTLVSRASQTAPIDKSVSTTNSGNYGQVDNYYSDKYNETLDKNDPTVWSERIRLPWYMTPDHDEENLIYEASTLRGGPSRGLIAKLVNPLNQYDELYEKTFLCLFSTFIKPTRLFEILIEKYRLTMPTALSYEEYGIWLEEKLKPQQKNVLSVFEKLFSNYWIVNYTTPELINIWESFINETPSIDLSLIELAAKVMSFSVQEEYIDYFNLGNSESKLIPMTPLNNTILQLKLQQMNINYVAEQITAVQAFYYRKLNLWDLLGRTYNFSRILRKNNDKKSNNSRDPLGTKNIANFIKNCNNMTHFTIYMILRRSDSQERIDSIKYFITLAEKLLTLKNYSSMTAIISGLSSTSISRLRKTWDGVPSSYVLKFQKMDNLMSIGKNYSEYRNILRFVENDGDPYLPFLGMYLSDLRFTTDGNSDWLTSKKGPDGLVNFAKRLNIMKIIREVMNFNETIYKIKLDPDFSRYLNEIFVELPDDEKMYEMSIEIEPRVSLFKNSKGISLTGLHTRQKNNVNSYSMAGNYNTFGSISTISSSQSGDTNNGDNNTNNNNDNNNNNNNNNVSNNKKGIDSWPIANRKPKRYRPLLSLTSVEKDREKDKHKKDKEREKVVEKELERSIV